MKANKSPDDYRQKPWDHRKGGDYKHKPEVIEGAPGGTVEYPRHIKDADGNTHHVKDAAHEAEIKATQPMPQSEEQDAA